MEHSRPGYQCQTERATGSRVPAAAKPAAHCTAAVARRSAALLKRRRTASHVGSTPRRASCDRVGERIPIVGRIPQGALGCSKAQHRQIVPDHLAREAWLTHSEEQLEGKVQPPGLGNGRPSLAGESDPRLGTQSEREVARRQGPEHSTRTGDTCVTRCGRAGTAVKGQDQSREAIPGTGVNEGRSRNGDLGRRIERGTRC